MLAGSEAVVERARLMLQRLGGASVHRAGIAAAAGLVALDTMVDGIADDHRRARELGRLLAPIPGVDAATGGDRDEHRPRRRRAERASSRPSSSRSSPQRGLRVLERDTSRIRLVTHRLIGDEEIERAAAIVAEIVERHAVPPLELPELDLSELELDRRS